jgi:hypothetical protein
MRDEVSKYHLDAAREIYTSARKRNNCPPMITMKVYDMHYFVESKDGLVLMEQVKADNAWEAKFEGVLEWVKLKGEK